MRSRTNVPTDPSVKRPLSVARNADLIFQRKRAVAYLNILMSAHGVDGSCDTLYPLSIKDSAISVLGIGQCFHVILNTCVSVVCFS
jgi:hypothetical protein